MFNKRKVKICFGVKEFHYFAHDIEKEWDLQTIRFKTNDDNLFDKERWQLSHLAKIDKPFADESFTGQLNKEIGYVKWFSFEFYRSEPLRSIKMFFDLTNNEAKIDSSTNIDERRVISILSTRMGEDRNNFKRIFDYLEIKKIVIEIIIIILGAIILLWLGLK